MPNALQILKLFPSVSSNPENQSISRSFNRNYTHSMKVLLVLRLHSLFNQRELLCRSRSRSRNRNRSHKQLLRNCCMPEHLIRNRNHSHSYLDIHTDTCRHLQVLSITGKLKVYCFVISIAHYHVILHSPHTTIHHTTSTYQTTQQSQYTGVERGRHAAQGRHRPPFHALRPTGATYAEHTAVRTFYYPQFYFMLPIGRYNYESMLSSFSLRTSVSVVLSWLLILFFSSPVRVNVTSSPSISASFLCLFALLPVLLNF
jgi:hypothetical protein